MTFHARATAIVDAVKSIRTPFRLIVGLNDERSEALLTQSNLFDKLQTLFESKLRPVNSDNRPYPYAKLGDNPIGIWGLWLRPAVRFSDPHRYEGDWNQLLLQAESMLSLLQEHPEHFECDFEKLLRLNTTQRLLLNSTEIASLLLVGSNSKSRIEYSHFPDASVDVRVSAINEDDFEIQYGQASSLLKFAIFEDIAADTANLLERVAEHDLSTTEVALHSAQDAAPSLAINLAKSWLKCVGENRPLESQKCYVEVLVNRPEGVLPEEMEKELRVTWADARKTCERRNSVINNKKLGFAINVVNGALMIVSDKNVG
jgi:hypothetical protein